MRDLAEAGLYLFSLSSGHPRLHFMDRNLRTPYNLRSSNHPAAHTAAAMASFVPSTSTSSDRLTAATSASVMSQPFSSLGARKQATTVPSPSGNETSIFWGQSQSQTTNSQTLHGMQPSASQHHAPSSVPAQPSERAGAAATAPFLRDFTLVAEAAKRAQMAVVMRDLEGISL